MFGGIIGQGVLKACSGKWSPIMGLLYCNADETLPDDVLPSKEVLPSELRRYDSQIAVFGKEMQKRILDQKQFLVGAGAIGCEMLKNWALMGVACGPEWQIHITDMDRIEKSKLSRHPVLVLSKAFQPLQIGMCGWSSDGDESRYQNWSVPGKSWCRDGTYFRWRFLW